MRHALCMLALALCSMTAAGQQPRGLERFGCGKSHAAAALAEHAQEWRQRPFAGDPDAAAAYREAYPATDVLENNLDLEVVLSPQRVHGSNTMTIKSLVDGLTEFSIILHPNFAASATINGVLPGAMTTFGTWGRRITLDRAYNAGEVFTVRVDYDGTPPPPTGFGGFVITSRAGKPEVYTLSQPFAAGCWWPCKDGDYGLPGDNSDKATLSIAVTVPSTMKTTANGMLQGVDDLGDGRSRTRFRSDYPMSTYLVCFASTDFNTWTPTWTYQGKSMPVEFNFYSEQDSPTARAQAAEILDMLTVFSGLFGPYPFIDEKYGVYQFGFGGGMEHQTNTGQIFFAIDWLNAHELAHQWWGDALTCKDWQHIWLNEGFATYAEALWEEFKPGSSGKPALLAAMAARKPNNLSGRVFVDNTASVNAIFDGALVYDKGGWVLHMLRYVVGDDAFFQGLRAYRQSHELGAVVTEDLQATFEAITGRDLGWFFQQWIYGYGVPQYRWSWTAATIDSKPYVRVWLAQQQSTSAGYQSKFTMPVELSLGRGSGSPRVTVFNDARAEWFMFPVTSIPDSVSPDPDNRILWSSVSNQAWSAAPPKVVQTLPTPGANRSAAAGVSSMKVWFSDPVQIDASKVALKGPAGPVPTAVSFDGSSLAATIAFAPLPAGAYELTLADSITAGGFKLDGELADPGSATSLPSGEGLPGGAAVIRFTIRCAADVDQDGSVALEDFFAFFNAWDNNQAAADVNENGVVDLDDFFAFFGAWDAMC